MTWRERLTFRVDGDPVGAARPRVVRRGAFASAFMPAEHVHAEGRITAQAVASFPPGWVALDEPVAVEIVAVHARPAKLVPKPRGRTPIPTTRMWCTTKPDADNVAKLVLDGLVKAGVMSDDTRVVRLLVTKEYAAIQPPEVAHVRVTVYTLAPPASEG